VTRRASIVFALLFAFASAARADNFTCDTATPELRLPFANAPHQVIQGVGGSFSHFGRYEFAWDFEMPEGTQVLAAASGTVVEVVTSFADGGPDRKFENAANVVVIDHGHDRFSIYQHLRKGGALVREGQTVARGQPIGLSGNTGWTTRPHLHFSVIDYRNRSVPVCFSDVTDGVPREGQSYRSRNKAVAAAALGEQMLTTIPRDAFAENGVLLDVDLPARWLGTRSPVRVTGHVTRPAARVAAFFLPRGDGHSNRYYYGRVDGSGAFAVNVDLAGLDGPLNFAMATTGEDGRFNSPFSVPCSIHPR
jgi:hypothetical protein